MGEQLHREGPTTVGQTLAILDQAIRNLQAEILRQRQQLAGQQTQLQELSESKSGPAGWMPTPPPSA
jgi:hypothetical protein